MSILIVEDNAITLRIIETSLQKRGYETISAKSGKEALENLFFSHNIDLIITDIVMPEIDGLELIKTIRSNHEWDQIPIIIATSLADLDTVKKAILMGVRHYIVKPIEKEQLYQKIKEALSKDQMKMENENDFSSIMDNFPANSARGEEFNMRIQDNNLTGEKAGIKDILKLLISAESKGPDYVYDLINKLDAKADDLTLNYINAEMKKLNRLNNN